jgi:hypothetical protein
MSTHPEAPGLLTGLRDGDWLHRQEFPPLRWTIPGIIPEGSTLFVGPPKIGKSWFLLNLCLALALGGRVLGGWVTKRPVLYLALEDGDRRLQERCRRLLLGEPIPVGFEYLTHVEPGMVLATVTEWLERHPDQQPVVVLDTLGKVLPPAKSGETTYSRDYRIGSALKRLVDPIPGASLVVAHHDRKAESADFIDAVSGSNGLAGSADTIVLLSRPRHDLDGTVQVTGRDVPEDEYAVTFVDGCRWELIGADLRTASAHAAQRRNTTNLSDRSTEVVAVVSQHPDGVRAGDVADELGIDEKQAGVYLGRLASTNRITRISRGLYTPLLRAGSVGSATEPGVLTPPTPEMNQHTPQPNTPNNPTDPPGTQQTNTQQALTTDEWART